MASTTPSQNQEQDLPDYASFVAPPPYQQVSSSSSSTPFPPSSSSRQAPTSLPSAQPLLLVQTLPRNDTRIYAAIERIKWGTFSSNPNITSRACLIAIKLHIQEPDKRSTLFSAHCTINIATLGDSSVQNTATADCQIAKILPLRRAGPKVKPTAAGYSVSIGADTPYDAMRSAWQLEGRINAAEKRGKGASANVSATWDVTSDLSTQAPLPKEVKVGAIVVVAGAVVGEKSRPGSVHVEVEVRAHFRSLMGSLMKPKGESAKGSVGLEMETGGVVSEQELWSYVTL